MQTSFKTRTYIHISYIWFLKKKGNIQNLFTLLTEIFLIHICHGNHNAQWCRVPMIWEAHLDSKIETNTQGLIASNKQHNLPSINNRNKVNYSPPTPPHPTPHQRCMTCVCPSARGTCSSGAWRVCVCASARGTCSSGAWRVCASARGTCSSVTWRVCRSILERY